MDRRDACFYFGQVFPGGGEAVGNKRAHPHAGLGKARSEFLAPVGLLHVLAQRELDAGRRGVEDQILRAGPVAQLDDTALAADGIGRAVEQVDGGDSAGELLVKVVRLGIHHVADADHGGGGQRGFVDGAENGGVAVRIDQCRG